MIATHELSPKGTNDYVALVDKLIDEMVIVENQYGLGMVPHGVLKVYYEMVEHRKKLNMEKT